MVDKYDASMHDDNPPGMKDVAGAALSLVQAQADLKDEAKSYTRTDAVEYCFETSDVQETAGHKLTGGTRGHLAKLDGAGTSGLIASTDKDDPHAGKTINFSRFSTQVLVGGDPVAAAEIPSLRQHALRIEDGANALAVSARNALFVPSPFWHVG